MALHLVVGWIHSFRGLQKIKRWERLIFSCPWHSWLSGLQTQLESTPSAAWHSGLWTPPLALWSPACRRQTVGLLILCNIKSQCLTTNLYIHIFLVRFSEELWLMYISNLICTSKTELLISPLPKLAPLTFSPSHFTAIVSFQWIDLKPQGHPWFPSFIFYVWSARKFW